MTINFSFDSKFIRDKIFENKLQNIIEQLKDNKRDKNHLLYHIIPDRESVKKIKNLTTEKRDISDTLIVVGIGGSSLAAKVFDSIKNDKKIIFFEGVDPRKLEKKLDCVDLKKIFLNIVSKSGNTLETLINSAYLIKQLKKIYGNRWKERVILTASEGEGKLIKWAKNENITILEIPQQVGGRFSAFTAAGFFPAFFVGLNEKKILKGIKKGIEKGLSCDFEKNISAQLAYFYLKTDEKKLPNIVLWGYGDLCYRLSLWVQQLWAESLGKKKREKHFGLFPISLKGSQDQHSILQLLIEGCKSSSILFLTEKTKGRSIESLEKKFLDFKKNGIYYGDIQNALKEGTKGSLQKQGIVISDFCVGKGFEEDVAEAMTLFIISTLILAEYYKIDPFSQNGVEEGKKITKSLLI